jgi:hypothetical protein
MYGQGIENSSDFQKNEIAARLAKAGVSQEQINQLMQFGMGAGQMMATGGSGGFRPSGGGGQGGYGSTGYDDNLMYPSSLYGG